MPGATHHNSILIYRCPCFQRSQNIEQGLSLSSIAESCVPRKEGLSLISMAIPIGCLCQCAMLQELVKLLMSGSRAHKLVGYRCQETGDRTGRPGLISSDKACHSQLLQVTTRDYTLTMLPELTGVLDKLTTGKQTFRGQVLDVLLYASFCIYRLLA